MTIVLVEGKGFPPDSDNGSSEPCVKFRLVLHKKLLINFL